MTGRKLIGGDSMKYDNKATHDFIKCAKTTTSFSFL